MQCFVIGQYECMVSSVQQRNLLAAYGRMFWKDGCCSRSCKRRERMYELAKSLREVAFHLRVASD